MHLLHWQQFAASFPSAHVLGTILRHTGHELLSGTAEFVCKVAAASAITGAVTSSTCVGASGAGVCGSGASASGGAGVAGGATSVTGVASGAAGACGAGAARAKTTGAGATS